MQSDFVITKIFGVITNAKNLPHKRDQAVFWEGELVTNPIFALVRKQKSFRGTVAAHDEGI